MSWLAAAATEEPGVSGGVVQLSWFAVALASAVLGVNVLVSITQSLGLHWSLLVSAARMVVQLSALGYILTPIFAYNTWWLVVCFLSLTTCLATLEAVQRLTHAYEGMLRHVLLAMVVSCVGLLAFMLVVVLGLSPVWDAQYAIPIAGMLLGNATSGVSVGLSTVLDDFAAGKNKIELLLAFGASKSEATRNLVKRAIRTASMPLINQMALMGLVSIPGMMTGQILAGSDPGQAARYQMCIMFIIGGASCLAATAVIYLAVDHLLDERHAFRSDRLTKKITMGAWLQDVRSKVVKGARQLRLLCLTCLCCQIPSSSLKREGNAHKLHSTRSPQQRSRQSSPGLAAAASRSLPGGLRQPLLADVADSSQQPPSGPGATETLATTPRAGTHTAPHAAPEYPGRGSSDSDGYESGEDRV